MKALQKTPVIPRVGRQEMEIPPHQFAKRSERREDIASPLQGQIRVRPNDVKDPLQRGLVRGREWVECVAVRHGPLHNVEFTWTLVDNERHKWTNTKYNENNTK